MEGDKSSRIDCLKCMYYATTWEKNFPRACKFHGFKSKYMPSISVFQSSGTECMGFVKKEIKK